jgi:hypothetical protein
VIDTGSNIGSPVEYTEMLINELEFVENTLIYGNDDEDIPYNNYLSSDHESILFENACDVP